MAIFSSSKFYKPISNSSTSLTSLSNFSIPAPVRRWRLYNHGNISRLDGGINEGRTGGCKMSQKSSKTFILELFLIKYKLTTFG